LGAARPFRCQIVIYPLIIEIQIRSYPETVAFYQKLGYKVEERVSMGKIV